jgi:hypothetical protein
MIFQPFAFIKRSGPQLWTPSQIGDSLVLWLDASDASTIILNGSRVSQWSDKSGNNSHVTNSTAATQPLYELTSFNDKPSVYFDSTREDFLFTSFIGGVWNSRDNSFMSTTFELLQTDRNWDMLMGWRNTPNSDHVSTAGVLILQALSPGAPPVNEPIFGVHNTDVSADNVGVTTPTRLGKRIATVGRTGIAGGENGTLTITATNASGSYKSVGTQTWESNPGYAGTTNFQIGGRQQAGTLYGNKRISEVVCCNNNLSEANRQRLEGYYAWKWNVVDTLPSDHPYKTAAPLA